MNHTLTLKYIFYFLFRLNYRSDFPSIKQDFLSISLVSKLWYSTSLSIVREDKPSLSLLHTSNCLNFDRAFIHLLNSLLHNFDLPSFPHYFESIINWHRSYLHLPPVDSFLPIDHCPWCHKLRFILDEDRWCHTTIGCHLWICRERINPHHLSCYCSPSISHKQIPTSIIQHHAYLLFLKSNNHDQLYNYFTALNNILYPPKVYPLPSFND